MEARSEKRWQLWQRVKPYLLGFLVVLTVAGAILALIYVPKMQVPVCPPGQEGLPPKVCFDIENEARKTLAYILAGILAIIGIYMAHRRIRALERQVLVAQEGQITERFTRAIEQLGSTEMAIRLGGIYALERIANDSDKDYWSIIETLTAYVRENAPWREPPPEAPEGVIGEEPASPETSTTPVPAARPKPATDIQAVLTVLGRRKYRYGPLDLRRTDLRGADFEEAHLEGAILSGANLEGAFLMYAQLKEAQLAAARLEGANLISAHLEEAFLLHAYIEGADLRDAHLECAVLMEAHLEGADLRDAHFESAILAEAHLERAILGKAHLEGADLSDGDATGLTREQLAEAFLDEKTILPDYLQDQPPKGKGPKGNDEE